MLSLPDAQDNFVDTINHGPDRLEPALFAGPQDRILLGLKAHANTISHARLVALEETFPLVRQEIGEAAFNRISRDYIDSGQARAADGNQLGKGFAAFLQNQPVDAAIADLAAIEWAWLESYHAADAVALCVADLGQIDEIALLAMRIARHPSVRPVAITAPLACALDELAGMQPLAIMTVRPDAEVRLVPLDSHQSVLLALAAQENCTLGNLLAFAFEQAGEQAPLEPLLHLIGAGALVKAG
jgi:hypothetical protein